MIQQFHFWVYMKRIASKDSNRYLYTQVHRSIIYNSKNVETIQISISGWMDKQNVGYTYSSILFSLYKEGSADTCYNVNEPWKHNVKWKKPLTKGQILYGSTYMTYLECSNSWRQKEWWLPGPRGRGIESYLMGTEFQFGMMKQFWRWLVVMVAQQCKCALCHWTVYLEMVKMVNFMLCIFYYNKKE